jgi:hypothetical protein
LTLKAIPGAVNGSNFGKTSIGSNKEFINEKNKKQIFDLDQNFFSFCVVLRLRGKIVPLPIMAQSKIFFVKSLYFDITTKEIIQILESKLKKISILCTFKGSL